MIKIAIIGDPFIPSKTFKLSLTKHLKTINPKPAKFNPEDKYSDYRRKAKEEILKEKGLL